MSLLLAYYGDDFTGSTDVMEALSKGGLRTVLFLAPPSPEQVARFPDLRAFGIAGGSRTMSPEEMEQALAPAFEALKASGAPIIHYKICSTFDSSPNIGSIGRAIEIGRRVFGERPTPLIVGAPVLGRYVVFGNLFARSGLDTEPFRLDRHPTMSRHPVTPMKEADIRLILAEQTKLPVELVDVLKLENAGGQWSVVSGQSRPPIMLFDTLREAHLPVIGREIARLADEEQLFVAGSSGVEYALVQHWRETGAISTAEEEGRGESPFKTPPRAPSSAVQQLVCVSGSCSPVTDRQIAQAVEAGFAEIALDPMRLLDSQRPQVDLTHAITVLCSGRSLVLHTSRGATDQRFQKNLCSSDRERLGRALGDVLDRLLEASGLKRAVVCGGDTSMAMARALGIEALEFAAPAAPGSPLCRVHAAGRSADGCEMVFKGGQNGRDRFLLDVLELAAGKAFSTEILRTQRVKG